MIRYFTNINMNRLGMHDALKQIAFLEGKWSTGKDNYGSGKFPTIKPFTFCEEITFTSIGQPMFNYVAQSWDSASKKPLHREVGFMKVIPGTNKVSLLLAHNFGLTTIEEGTIENNIIKLKSTGIIRQSEGMKLPNVIETCREFEINGNSLKQIFYMATSTVPELTEHLCTTYTKISKESDE
ncbi:peroxynitrite isomerase THAP4-like isoform X1 [Vespa velutina]|uniref:peroxynitrite isomerase THAP4-like isoform X1 n=2 Tax=Vespa velutina TaxID=202808 RepID=UPI001FB48D75|nr:peroxynitrite isomerase THAP4-like isoform X1 [Vespa velutina]